ncbi:fungal-specific transcription factor domain-containing protein [Mycena capillaripes]|nr:fungal-specific transcription factor domain-containing protein [Mycena capillaripes]
MPPITTNHDGYIERLLPVLSTVLLVGSLVDGHRPLVSDGAQMPGNRCSNCTTYGFGCSYVEAAKKRGPPKGYVESMEIRIEKMERLLQTLLPEAEFEQVLSGSSAPSWQVPPLADEDERAQLSLTENLQQLSLNSDRDIRFFGRSSGAMLLQTALNVKLDAEPQNARRHTEFWASRPSPEPVPPPRYDFPPRDLAASLIDLYFTHINILLPLLHRPTFARDLAAGLHLINDGFAATFLLVCAIGARFSSDPRVLLDGSDNLHSCGWRWFKQLQLMRDPLGPPPCLYDLQFSALSVLFLHGTSAPQACWTLVSIGIRMAQDVGAHRRKEATHPWNAEDELWKRAFWVLVLLDRTMSSNYGRPCAIQDEEQVSNYMLYFRLFDAAASFDLDFPIDCDDEYWDTETPESAGAFRQPKDKPSLISAFIAHLRLCQVLSFALRTIYSISKSQVLLGLNKGNTGDLEKRILVELDAALNKWMDEIPDHLRWNPTHENADFFEQSVALYCSYYQLQILIHRAYIPSPKKMAPVAFPSLAICLNAARSCSHVVDIHRQRTGGKPLPLVQAAVFTAGLVMLLNIWAGKRGGLALTTDSGQEMTEVQRCMQVLRGCETRWQSAGRLWDVLFDLASVGQLPLPAANTKNKRERGAEEPKSATADRGPGSLSPVSASSSTNSGNSPAREPRVMAGRRRPIQAGTDGPDIISSGGPNSHSVPPGPGHRLHAPDVPAITTQFLPQSQHRSHGYPPETPLSTSSLHGQQHDRFTMPMRGDESHRHPSYASTSATPLSTTSLHGHHPEVFLPSMRHEDSQSLVHPHPLGPPDTPLSASSLHGFVPPMHRSGESQSHGHARARTQPNTPISASSISGIPLVPSMNNGLVALHERLDFSHTQEINDSLVRSGRVNSQVHWYPDEARTGHGSGIHPQHPHSSSTNDSDNNSSRMSASFPISEAFFDHLTASFSSPAPDERSYNRLPHPNYADQARHEYPDGARHRVPSNTRGGDIEQDTMAMWSAPIGFEVEDWNSYLDTQL